MKRLTTEDIGAALKLSAAEKWNQTEKDWSFLISSPENICLAAVENGKVIGSATAITYNNEVAWIGMVLVDKDFRGRGISLMLIYKLLEKLKHCRSIKLDATPAGQPVYEKVGFSEEYKILRMIHPTGEFENISTGKNEVTQVSEIDLKDVVDYDHHVFGANRKKLIEFLYNQNRGNSWMIKTGEKIDGFALAREGARFYQLGPVSAISPEIGKVLIRKSLEKLKDKPVVIDVLEEKKELVLWLDKLGFIVQRSFTRMFHHKNANPGSGDKQYLICGPEFG